jgi:hypothetical protein
MQPPITLGDRFTCHMVTFERRVWRLIVILDELLSGRIFIMQEYTLILVLELIKMICAICQSHRMRRISRKGLLRKVLAPLFGYYPWRCSSCFTEFMLKSRGQRRTVQVSNSQHEHLSNHSHS